MMKKIFFILLQLLFAQEVLGVEVTAIYRGGCRVNTGVVIKVDKVDLYLLNLQGDLDVIRKFEIIGMAKYPIPSLPVAGVNLASENVPKWYEFQTLEDGSYKKLTAGWPIEYSLENIQVLSESGKDVLVERDVIWRVRDQDPPKRLNFGDAIREPYNLRHPLSFEQCAPNIISGSIAKISIRPQTVMDDPISIKHHLDHLREGLEKIQDYDDRQRFYAVPQVYRNRTLLGTWFVLNTRYSNIGARRINLLPFVQDEYSEGPFGFQRIVRSGVAPLSWTLHEEPVLQAYYGLKADYVTVDLFFDPAALLLGSRYSWSRGHLDAVDDRYIESGGFMFGINIKYFSMFFTITGGKGAVRANKDFLNEGFGGGGFGMGWQYKEYKIMGLIGDFGMDKDFASSYGDTEKRSYSLSGDFARINLNAQFGEKFNLGLIYISRKVDVSATEGVLTYTGKSNTLAAQLNWNFDYRWTIYSLLSAENHNAEAVYDNGAGDDSKNKTYPKLAGGITVAF